MNRTVTLAADDRDAAMRPTVQTRTEPTVAESIGDFVARYSGWLLAAVLAVVIAAAHIYGHRKPLWFDELFSVVVAMQTSWHATAGAIPPGANPPLLAFLIRACMHLFGSSDASIRLPSLIAFLGALVGAYVFVRREVGPVFAILAVLFVINQAGWAYSYEARPYTLLTFWIMLALVSWQSAVRAGEPGAPRSRALPLMGLAIAIAGSVITHNLGIGMVAIPLLSGEITRIVHRRKIDWPILATALAAIPALVWTFPMIRQTDTLLLQYQREYLHPITWAKFVHYGIDFPMESFFDVLSLRAIFWMLLLILLSWKPRRHAMVGQDAGFHAIPRHILAAAAGCALLFPVIWVFMMSTTGYFLCRYGIGTIFGLAILAVLLTGRRQGRSSPLAVLFICLLMFQFCADALWVRRTVPIILGDALVYNNPSNLPIVVNDPYRFFPTWWYAPQSIRNRLFYLSDHPLAIKNGYVIVEVALTEEGRYFPARFAEFNTFVATHDHFILDQTGTANLDMPDRLHAAGFTLKPIAWDFRGTLYDVQRDAAVPAAGSKVLQ